MNILIVPQCPRCGSHKTGIIKPQTTYSVAKELRDQTKSIQRGFYIKYVDGKKYETYYKQFSIQNFCMDCSYEFQGDLETVEMDKEAYQEYWEEMGFQEMLKKTQGKWKRQSKAILNLIKSFWNRNPAQEDSL